MDDDRIQTLSARGALYRLLAHLYRREPTLALAERLCQTGLVDTLVEAGFHMEAIRDPDDDKIAWLRREYARVFLAPGPHVSPYGSVHHPADPKKGRLWGDTTVQVKRIMTALGVSLKGDAYDGIPDHIGHLAELVALLYEGEAAARVGGDEGRAERLARTRALVARDHLHPWVPDFCDKVMAVDEGGFYGELARLTKELVREEPAEAAEEERDVRDTASSSTARQRLSTAELTRSTARLSSSKLASSGS